MFFFKWLKEVLSNLFMEVYSVSDLIRSVYHQGCSRQQTSDFVVGTTTTEVSSEEN